jgi:hypothetical protein
MAGFDGTDGVRIGDTPFEHLDAVSGRPVRQFTAGGYFVEVGGARHFWGRVLDGVVYLAAFVVLVLLAFAVRGAMRNSLSLMELGYNDVFFYVLLSVLWFLGLYGYGMVWGSVGTWGDRAAGMRSLKLADGTQAGAWRGGWRAVAWSFFPVFAVMAIVSALGGGGDESFDSAYCAVDLRSGIAQGIPPRPAAGPSQA